MLRETIETSTVEVIEGTFSVLRLPPDTEVPFQAFLVAHDSTETTAIVPADKTRGIPAADSQDGFRILRINISAPFQAPGFLAAASSAIAAKGANVYIVSTFSRDYILVREADLETSLAALRSIGFPVRLDQPAVL